MNYKKLTNERIYEMLEKKEDRLRSLEIQVHPVQIAIENLVLELKRRDLPFRN